MHKDEGSVAPTWAAVPAARYRNIVVSDLDGEMLAYDQAAHQIHHLNGPAATVWRLCDGHRSAAEIARDAGLSGQMVSVALANIAGAGLLDAPLASGQGGTGRSRRALLKTAVIAGAIPAVVSVTAPTAAAAASVSLEVTCALATPDCSNFLVCCSSTCTQRGGSIVSVGLNSCTPRPSPPGGGLAIMTCRCSV